MASVFTTKVEVANLALEMLGSNTISSFEEDTRESQLMKRYYELYIKTALNKHEWRFCITEQQASLLSESPIPQWSYGYELPSDMLQLKSVYTDNRAGNRANYQDYQLFADNTLCTNTNGGIWVHYKQRGYETRWPAYFIDFAAHHLAIKLAPMLGRQFNTQKTLFEITYGLGGNSVFDMACEADCSQYSPEELDTFYIHSARETY